MKIKKVSVIIPIYKVDRYREDIIWSISSFLNSYNAEFIFVNNDISKIYELEDFGLSKIENVKIINNKKNIGLLLSRYEGVKNISEDSDGFMFLDGDDYFENLKQIFDYDKNKIWNFGYNEIYKDKVLYESPNGGVSKYKLNNQIWGVFFPKEIAHTHAKYFNDDNLYDDFAIKEFIALDQKFFKVDKPLINYRMRKSSISKILLSNNFANKQIHSRIKLFDLTKEHRFLSSGKEDLCIFKKSYTKKEYLKWMTELKKRGAKWYWLSGTLYRIFRVSKILLMVRNLKNKYQD